MLPLRMTCTIPYMMTSSSPSPHPNATQSRGTSSTTTGAATPEPSHARISQPSTRDSVIYHSIHLLVHHSTSVVVPTATCASSCSIRRRKCRFLFTSSTMSLIISRSQRRLSICWVERGSRWRQGSIRLLLLFVVLRCRDVPHSLVHVLPVACMLCCFRSLHFSISFVYLMQKKITQ